MKKTGFGKITGPGLFSIYACGRKFGLYHWVGALAACMLGNTLY